MTEAAKQEFVAKEKQAIISGRMPVAIVALARFGNKKDEPTKALATLFGTTVGKIDDIKKNRNFAYVTAEFRPTQEMIDAGIAWLKTHPRYDADGVDALVTELENTPVATAEEAAAFEAIRTASRGQSDTTKDGEKADGGGGNRRKPRAKKGEVADLPAAEGDTGATADALLA